MRGNAGEIAIGGQQRKTVLDAGRGDQAVDGSDLDASRSAALSKRCSRHIGFTFEGEQRKGCEETPQALKILLAPQAIQQFLENIADEEDPVARFNMGPEGTHHRIDFVNPLTPEHQRPN